MVTVGWIRIDLAPTLTDAEPPVVEVALDEIVEEDVERPAVVHDVVLHRCGETLVCPCLP